MILIRIIASSDWVDVISAIKKVSPDFLFMAEAYWDPDWELQQKVVPEFTSFADSSTPHLT
jgi:hypothetical protein